MKKTLITGFIYLFFSYLLLIPSVFAQDSNSYEGKYELVKPPQPTATPDKVEVLELFSYSCPHCFAFEKVLSVWLQNKPADIEFKHVPAVFQDSWMPLAKLYYTAEALNVLERVHISLFEAIHVQKRKMDETTMQQIFAEKGGVSKADFSKTYQSFSVDSKTRQSHQITGKYGIDGVPTLIVNGKYRVTPDKADGYDNMIKIINYLVDKERQAMLSATTSRPAAQQ